MVAEDSGSSGGRHRSGPPQRSTRSHRRKRSGLRVRWVAGFVFAVLLGFGGWLAFNAVTAKSGLEDARNNAMAAKAALLAGDSGGAASAIERAQNSAARATDAVDSIPWRVAADVPWVGKPFLSITQIAEVVRDLTDKVLPPASDAAQSLAPNKLRTPAGGVDWRLLERSAPALDDATTAVDRAALKARAIGSSGYLPMVDDVRDQLRNQVDDLALVLGNTSTAANLLPRMLGGYGSRSYVLAFQTNAEARGTGGLVGGLGIVHARDGVVQVDNLVTDIELKEWQPLDLGPQFDKLYGPFKSTQIWQNSNISPHFPYAGQIWQSLWRQRSGDTVDGAIATDPVALSYLLAAVGPVTLDNGEVIDDRNVVQVTESEAYERFSGDQTARKDYLGRIAFKVVEKVSTGAGDSAIVLEALGKAASEGRLSVWSAHPAEQAIIGDTALGHALPYSPAPYANVIVNNSAGSKLDYFLERSIDYSASSCTGSTRTSDVTVTLTNAVTAQELPAYVEGVVNDNPAAPPGTNKVTVSLYGTWGASLRSVSVNGRPADVGTGSDQGHPVFYVLVDLPPREPVEIKFGLTEPSANGLPQAPLQPLVAPAEVDIDVPRCGQGD